MRKKILVLSLMLFLNKFSTIAQCTNLIVNNDFENGATCQIVKRPSIIRPTTSDPFAYIDNWVAQLGSPDLFTLNTCSDQQFNYGPSYISRGSSSSFSNRPSGSGSHVIGLQSAINSMGVTYHEAITQQMLQPFFGWKNLQN